MLGTDKVGMPSLLAELHFLHVGSRFHRLLFWVWENGRTWWMSRFARTGGFGTTHTKVVPCAWPLGSRFLRP